VNVFDKNNVKTQSKRTAYDNYLELKGEIYNYNPID
jgi:hypothetical protein